MSDIIAIALFLSWPMIGGATYAYVVSVSDEKADGDAFMGALMFGWIVLVVVAAGAAGDAVRSRRANKAKKGQAE